MLEKPTGVWSILISMEELNVEAKGMDRYGRIQCTYMRKRMKSLVVQNDIEEGTVHT